MSGKTVAQIGMLLPAFMGFVVAFDHVGVTWQTWITGALMLLAVSFALRDGAFQKYFMKAVVTVSFWFISFELIFIMALHLYPTMTPGGHRSMAIGQAISAIVLGIPAAAVLSYFYFRWFSVHTLVDKYFLWILAASLLMLYLLDHFGVSRPLF